MDLLHVKKLIIDRKKPEDFSKPLPTVCLGLNQTLCYTVKRSESKNLPKSWLDRGIEVSFSEDEIEIIPRPGAAELLIELIRYVSPMIYSSLPHDFIHAVLEQLSTPDKSPELCSDEEYEKWAAFSDLYIWSRDQCVKEAGGYRKCLGTLAEFAEAGINDTWLIDNELGLVDFPNHVISVSAYAGDPEDNELYRVIDQIFT